MGNPFSAVAGLFQDNDEPSEAYKKLIREQQLSQEYLDHRFPDICIRGKDGEPYMSWDLVFRDKFRTLEEFTQNVLQPADRATKNCVNWSSVSESYRQALLNKFGSSIVDVVQGGSLIKGTEINNDADVDLVIFFTEFKTVREFRKTLPSLLDQLGMDVRGFSWHNTGVDFFRAPDSVTVTGHTVCCEIDYRPQSLRLMIDIVPAISYQEDPQTLYKLMSTLSADDRRYYSSSLVKWQTEFVRNRPKILKDFIRLLKYWRKTHLRANVKGQPKIPKSYALELIAIGVWESIGCPENFAFDRMMKKVLLQLFNYKSLNMSWTTYYTKEQMEEYSRGTRVDGKPFLLDPCDPFHNIGGYFDWVEMADIARITANSPHLVDVQPL